MRRLWHWARNSAATLPRWRTALHEWRRVCRMSTNWPLEELPWGPVWMLPLDLRKRLRKPLRNTPVNNSLVNPRNNFTWNNWKRQREPMIWSINQSINQPTYELNQWIPWYIKLIIRPYKTKYVVSSMVFLRLRNGNDLLSRFIHCRFAVRHGAEQVRGTGQSRRFGPLLRLPEHRGRQFYEDCQWHPIPRFGPAMRLRRAVFAGKRARK